MIHILVRFMQIGRARESWQIYHKALPRFMDLPALACTSNLHEPHQNMNHSLSEPLIWLNRFQLYFVLPNLTFELQVWPHILR